jgi:hypothetical protein
MTTLALLKAEIADDLDRTDLATQITSEISRAIRYYQRTRFYFNETRDETFSTVSDQKLYSSSDDAAIPEFIEIDQIYLMDGSEPQELEEINPKEWELLTASGGATGRPCAFCYFNRSLGFYPIPDQAYTIRPVGHIMKDEPADDAETGNVWMTEAFDLLRARVCAQLGQRKLRDVSLVQAHRPLEQDELWRLNSETNTRVGTGFVTPSEF